jgi:transposase
VSSDRIYRFLDELQSQYKERVEKISFEHTKKILNGSITVVFYDMTTLYFEAEDEDDLRKIGFSKDGKFQQPQIMIGLLVGENGYPIGYDIFEGNTFEGHTFLPILESIGKKYDFQKPIVVADAGLLSKDNIEKLKTNGYTFIIGGRVKSETEAIKNEIFKRSGSLGDGGGIKIKKPDGTNLIVTYSLKRARKDKYNREKGLKKLRQQIQYGKLTKQHINNRGYNKFLTISGKVKIAIDEEKIKADECWDGLKGYITNTKLSVDSVVKNYTQLWQVEKAFRISKTDLRVRPIYHRLKRRIEAHICIAFTAYAIYKELERMLNNHRAGFSAARAIELTQNMYEISYQLPNSRKQKTKYLKMDDEQLILFDIIKNS